MRDVENGSSGNNPYVEGSFRTAVNSQFSLRSYVRYGVEDDTLHEVNHSEVMQRNLENVRNRFDLECLS